MSITTYTATNDGGVPLPEVVLALYSKEIEHNALPVLRFANFSVKKMELVGMPGRQITFTKYADLTRGGQLTENVSVTPVALDASQHSITVYEWGNVVQVTEFLLRTAFDSTLSETAYLLSRDFALVRDKMNRDALATTTNIVYAGAGAGSLGTTSAGLVPDDVLDATEVLRTNNAPTFIGDYYIGFIHPHQGTALKKSDDWRETSNYAGGMQVFEGEIGMYDRVRFIETSLVLNGATSSDNDAYDAELVDSGAAGADLYRALICGDSAYGEATGLPVELRHSGVLDHLGRKHGLGWYSIMGADILNEDYAVAVITA